ncbi:MAG: PKD domain-containing protein, partial [Sphingobacteriales bacterium]
FTLVKQVEVLPQPIATFVSNASPLNCAPFTLTVYASQAQASGGVEWDFGDPDNSGYSAQGFTVNYTYTKPGLYRVKAVAYNQSGCADSTIQMIRITASPKASFSTADTMICGPGRNISFVNTTSYDGAGAVGYKWYVNNTLASTVKDLNYNFSTPSNVILPYIFEVKLIALSTIGCPDTAIHHIQFNPLPKANFALQQNIGCAPYQAVINNSSTYADSFKWYLDDVLVSTERTPQDIFTASPSKTYRLKLVTANIYGCKPDSIEKTLTTHPKPLASFTVNDSISCNGKLDLQTTNTSNGAISYTWNFGDATLESNATIPSHTYSLPGRYVLRLIAYNGFCRDTSSIQIRISPVPKATFISNKTKGCTKEDITFQNLSENADTYLWDFGDGSY